MENENNSNINEVYSACKTLLDFLESKNKLDIEYSEQMFREIIALKGSLLFAYRNKKENEVKH